MNKLLRPLGGLTLFNRERPFRCFSSIDLVVVPGRRRRHMGTTVTHPPPRESAGSAAAADPASVMLDRWGCLRGSSANVVADDNTVAESRTSWGQPLRVALARAPPPAFSFICFDRGEDGGGDKLYGNFVYVIAAHGDSILFQMTIPHVKRRLRSDQDHPRNDYFVYRAAAGRSPSLSLLPVCDIPMNQRCWDSKDRFKDRFSTTGREFDQQDTGILRLRGGGVDREVDDGAAPPLVAQIQIAHEPPFDTAELCVLRPGHGEWELKTAVPIVHHDSGGGERRHGLEMWQETNVAVPVGDRFMCWANYDLSTFLICDMATAADHPKLLYVPLPVKPVPPKESDFDDDHHDELIPWEYFRNIVASADGDDIVRFVSIDNRCCCGAPVIRSLCERSSSAFMVTMWSLALRNAGDGDGEPMAWVKEAVLDCEELWAMLAPCEGLPRRVYVVCPFVSSENPDVVWFVARSDDIGDDEVGKIWTLEIDVRRKTLISVVPLPRHPHRSVNNGKPLPAKLHGC